MASLIKKSLMKAATSETKTEVAAPISEHFHHDIDTVKTIVGPGKWTEKGILIANNKRHVEHAADVLTDNPPKWRLGDKSTISNFTRGSKLLNETLIANKNPHPVSMHHRAVANLFKRAVPLSQDLHVYSGTNHWDPTSIMQSNTIHTLPYISTSIDPYIASSFLGSAASSVHTSNRLDDHIIHFHLPAGYNKGLYIAPHSKLPYEKEFLLDHNQHWEPFDHNTTKAYSDGSVTHMWSVRPKTVVNEAEEHRPGIFDDAIGDKLHEPIDLQEYEKIPDFAINAHDNWLRKIYVSSREDRKLNDIQHIHLHTKTHEVWEKAGMPNSEAVFDNFNGENARLVSSPVAKYTRSSKSINNYLIDKHKENILDKITKHTLLPAVPHLGKKYATDLQEALPHVTAPLDSDIHVYSGLRSWDPSVTFNRSKIIHLPAFTSTSIDAGTGKTFSGSHILHFHLPAGYSGGSYISGHSLHKWEREYLIHPGQKFKLVNHEVVHTHDLHDIANGSPKIERHVWSVVPHNVEKVDEAFNHDGDHPFFLNVKAMSPAATKPLDAGFEGEHAILSILHDPIVTKYASHVRRITGASHFINNDLVRNKVHPIYKTMHENLLQMFKEVPKLTREHHVYSGLGDFDPQDHFDRGNGKFRIKSYISTSIVPQIAVRHTNLKGMTDDDEHILHFILPKGYKHGAYIANYSPFISEREMLLRPNQTFEVVKKNTHHIVKNNTPKQRHIWTVIPAKRGS